MFRIKIKMKKGSRPSIILLTTSILALFIADIVDNIYIKAATLFVMAVIAAEITEKFLLWKEKKKGIPEDHGRE
ncbi:TPA: hypothetical protein QCX12_001551 [Bacillus paranthracis]|nr:hypothetical protein [Bacillus paranthracis]